MLISNTRHNMSRRTSIWPLKIKSEKRNRCEK